MTRRKSRAFFVPNFKSYQFQFNSYFIEAKHKIILKHIIFPPLLKVEPSNFSCYSSQFNRI